jgi:TRAP-type C4-dicarboxylate transport system substrate-binding protein
MFRNIRARVATTVAAAAISATAFVLPAAAQQTFEFAVWYSDRDFYAPMTTKWAQQVEQITNGRVKIKLHYSGSLVPAKDTVAAVRNGAVGGGTTSISFLAPIVRELSYMEPFFWIPAEAKAGQEMMNKLTPASRELMEKRGMALIFALPSSGLITACRRDAIRTVADWKGKKVRAAGRLQGLQLTAVGASPVAIDPGELYIALQNGTVDCTMFLANLALSGKIYEVAPNVTYWNDGANSSFYYLNLDQWKKVSAEDQKRIIEMSDKLAQDWAVEQIGMQQQAAKELEKLGAKVYFPTRAEIDLHKKAMSSVWGEIDKLVGASGKLFSDVITKQ